MPTDDGAEEDRRRKGEEVLRKRAEDREKAKEELAKKREQFNKLTDEEKNAFRKRARDHEAKMLAIINMEASAASQDVRDDQEEEDDYEEEAQENIVVFCTHCNIAFFYLLEYCEQTEEDQYIYWAKPATISTDTEHTKWILTASSQSRLVQIYDFTYYVDKEVEVDIVDEEL